jgi:hypothetical protein
MTGTLASGRFGEIDKPGDRERIERLLGADRKTAKPRGTTP